MGRKSRKPLLSTSLFVMTLVGFTSTGKPVYAGDGPCGGAGERACCCFGDGRCCSFICGGAEPACDSGLIPVLFPPCGVGGGIPSCGGCSARWCANDTPCGGDGQRACCVDEGEACAGDLIKDRTRKCRDVLGAENCACDGPVSRGTLAKRVCRPPLNVDEKCSPLRNDCADGLKCTIITLSEARCYPRHAGSTENGISGDLCRALYRKKTHENAIRAR